MTVTAYVLGSKSWRRKDTGEVVTDVSLEGMNVRLAADQPTPKAGTIITGTLWHSWQKSSKGPWESIELQDWRPAAA